MIISTPLVLRMCHNSLIDFCIFVSLLSLGDILLLILYTRESQYDVGFDWIPCTMISSYIALDAG